MSRTPPQVRRNATVELVRSLVTSTRKRGGARYGPAPEKPPHERMQSPAPMSEERRAEIHGRRRVQNGRTK